MAEDKPEGQDPFEIAIRLFERNRPEDIDATAFGHAVISLVMTGRANRRLTAVAARRRIKRLCEASIPSRGRKNSRRGSTSSLADQADLVAVPRWEHGIVRLSELYNQAKQIAAARLRGSDASKERRDALTRTLFAGLLLEEYPSSRSKNSKERLAEADRLIHDLTLIAALSGPQVQKRLHTAERSRLFNTLVLLGRKRRTEGLSVEETTEFVAANRRLKALTDAARMQIVLNREGYPGLVRLFRDHPEWGKPSWSKAFQHGKLKTALGVDSDRNKRRRKAQPRREAKP